MRNEDPVQTAKRVTEALANAKSFISENRKALAAGYLQFFSDGVIKDATLKAYLEILSVMDEACGGKLATAEKLFFQHLIEEAAQ